MGALHRGHAALIRKARKLAGPHGTVAVSIFVNPTQFGPREDLSRYPRPLKADLRVCEQEGADVVFHPDAESIYPSGYSTYVEETSLSASLCGAARPGHFRGVCTVVHKLFQIVQPDIAVFGLKDFQQCMVIRRMVKDLNLPVRIVAAPTVRERDGLALSSRNQYLTAEEREQAPILQEALQTAAAAVRSGETRPARIKRLLLKALSRAPLARADYVEIVEAETLQPARAVGRGCVMALAVFFGKTRLIDNLWIR